MGKPIPRGNLDLGMEAFNKQIQDVEKQVDKLAELLKKLKDANEETKFVTKAYAMKAIKKHMEKYIEMGKIARRVKAKLEKPGCEKGSGVDRAKVNMTNALTKKFRDIMIEFQKLRQRIQDEYREVVERQTIDNLIETGNNEQIFQKAIQVSGQGHVLNTLEEIQEKHDVVKEIEKKLLNLHQM
ncbi:hypothetical protein UlMin_044619 [Ulmus minor]